MPHWTDEYRDMIEDCGNRPAQLSEWEEGFLNSLSEQLEERNSLTPKQCATLTRVWEKVTKNG